MGDSMHRRKKNGKNEARASTACMEVPSADLGRNQLLTDNIPHFLSTWRPQSKLALNLHGEGRALFVKHQPLAQAVAMEFV